mmetsp:Transcript_14460/g.36612  ORF Transcript_14460/g.36612 Transcript_14460/m.36612 type:complete len:165 (-) Transcript_14460:209-703(-)
MTTLEKERKIRERVTRAFAATRESFEEEEEWNNYLEEREDIAFNLVEGIDVEESERRLRDVEASNAHIIAASHAREVEMHHRISMDANDDVLLLDKDEKKRMSYTPEKTGNGLIGHDMLTPESERRQEQLALLASGWSKELVRKRAIQESLATFIIPPGRTNGS